MSDWSRQRFGLRTVLAAVAVVVVAVGVFVAGRATAPAAGTPTAGTVVSPFLTASGVPAGYSHDAVGAQTSAVNALVAGLRLRQSTGGLDLRMLAVPNTQATAGVSLLLNLAPTVCAGLDTATVCSPAASATNAQAQVYNFAPDVKTAGVLTGASISTLPTVQLDGTGDFARVGIEWVETRTTATAASTPLATAFVLTMQWADGDWRVQDGGATKLAPPVVVVPWLTVISFISEPSR